MLCETTKLELGHGLFMGTSVHCVCAQEEENDEEYDEEEEVEVECLGNIQVGVSITPCLRHL